MHLGSLLLMREKFIAKYLSPNKATTILDIGSRDINGTYHNLFINKDLWTYTGFDVEVGVNVDIVGYENLLGVWDVIICGQVLEHMPLPWVDVPLIVDHLTPEGLACFIAPCVFPEHRYPLDCYRYYPDGMRALLEWSGLSILECSIVGNDTFAICRK